MTSVIDAYHGAYEHFGDAAFGAMVDGQTHDASLIGDRGEYLELGLFVNGPYGQHQHALTRVPTDARYRHVRDLVIGAAGDRPAHRYREDAYDYLELGLDDAPMRTKRRNLTPAAEATAVAQAMHRTIILKKSAAIALQLAFRGTDTIGDYRALCRNARRDRTAHLGLITPDLLAAWSSENV
ncbi:MAG TPA: hypothetical protein VLE99_02925 [Candidatus Saccharimonadales bacterium]|nr:hypothetical protein [Candidatus Saccharimonadales bacterium]